MTVAIVQARMGSSRLPGKIMLSLAGKPVLWHVVNRLRFAKKLDNVIVATTTNQEDDIVEAYCRAHSIHVFRGSSEDVLSRYYDAAKASNADTVVRVTSDCPLIDPDVVDATIGLFVRPSADGKPDYASNTLKRTFPRGLDVEVISFEALEKAYLSARASYEREHVTPYIYFNTSLFRLRDYLNDRDVSHHRWTLDTLQDYQLLYFLYHHLYIGDDKPFLFAQVLDFVERHPEISALNKDVPQKPIISHS